MIPRRTCRDCGGVGGYWQRDECGEWWAQCECDDGEVECLECERCLSGPPVAIQDGYAMCERCIRGDEQPSQVDLEVA
jgi:hypothetical protein